MLLEHHWPGNLRELKNVLERALLQRSGPTVHAADVLFDAPSEGRMRAAPPSLAAEGTRTLSQVERQTIYEALLAEGGRVEAAARRLGIPRSTLYQRIKEYGISPSQMRARTGSDGS